MIAVEDLDELSEEPNFETEILPAMKEEFKAVYQELIKDEWFPRFGEPETSGARGYGTGPSEQHPLPHLVLFTSQFPELTFVIFYSWWDYFNLTVYRIKDDQILNVWDQSYEEISFGKVKVGLQVTDLFIDEDFNVTDFFVDT